MSPFTASVRVGLMTLLCLLLLTKAGTAAPAAKAWKIWDKKDSASTITVDHSSWNDFLQRYVSIGDDGINRVNYKGVSPADRKGLDQYLQKLSEVPVTRLNRLEQLPFWINLYNGLTVRVILDHYPVASIRDIDISPGLFKDGPWGKKLISIEGTEISLDDIEHRILRPLFHDNRIHYAVNCASLGCPNLQPTAFTAVNSQGLLAGATWDYINHPRGMRMDGDKLTVSSIYKWFVEDFGGSEKALIRYLRQFADSPLQEKLKQRDSIDSYDYDWSLNGIP